MNIKQCLNLLVLSVAMLVTGVSYAAVVTPALYIETIEGDTGVDLGSFSFSIDATALFIDTAGDPIDIPDETFSLISPDGKGSFVGDTGTFSGTFTIGDLLYGSFTDLTVISSGGSDGEFFGDLAYDGGSLMGDLTSGRIEGEFSGVTLVEFTTTLGEVAAVPVPAAVWLFASGLLGLAGVARRKV